MPMSPMQSRIFDIVSKAKSGVPIRVLVDRVYADRADGGPPFADQVVRGQIVRLNRRLRNVAMRIAPSPRFGGHYTLLERCND